LSRSAGRAAVPVEPQCQKKHIGLTGASDFARCSKRHSRLLRGDRGSGDGRCRGNSTRCQEKVTLAFFSGEVYITLLSEPFSSGPFPHSVRAARGMTAIRISRHRPFGLASRSVVAMGRGASAPARPVRPSAGRYRRPARSVRVRTG
jgi:hypothetical protein